MMPTFFYILVKVYVNSEVKLCGSLAIEAVIDVMKAHMRTGSHGHALDGLDRIIASGGGQ